jgi:hypothetical protein
MPDDICINSDAATLRRVTAKKTSQLRLILNRYKQKNIRRLTLLIAAPCEQLGTNNFGYKIIRKRSIEQQR